MSKVQVEPTSEGALSVYRLWTLWLLWFLGWTLEWMLTHELNDGNKDSCTAPCSNRPNQAKQISRKPDNQCFLFEFKANTTTKWSPLFSRLQVFKFCLDLKFYGPVENIGVICTSNRLPKWQGRERKIWIDKSRDTDTEKNTHTHKKKKKNEMKMSSWFYTSFRSLHKDAAKFRILLTQLSHA